MELSRAVFEGGNHERGRSMNELVLERASESLERALGGRSISAALEAAAAPALDNRDMSSSKSSLKDGRSKPDTLEASCCGEDDPERAVRRSEVEWDRGKAAGGGVTAVAMIIVELLMAWPSYPRDECPEQKPPADTDRLRWECSFNPTSRYGVPVLADRGKTR